MSTFHEAECETEQEAVREYRKKNPLPAKSAAVLASEYQIDRDRAAKVRRDTLERQLIAVEKELRGEAKRKVTEARLWLLEGDG